MRTCFLCASIRELIQAFIRIAQKSVLPRPHAERPAKAAPLHGFGHDLLGISADYARPKIRLRDACSDFRNSDANFLIYAPIKRCHCGFGSKMTRPNATREGSAASRRFHRVSHLQHCQIINAQRPNRTDAADQSMVVWDASACGATGWQSIGLTSSGTTGTSCDLRRWFAPTMPRQSKRPSAL